MGQEPSGERTGCPSSLTCGIALKTPFACCSTLERTCLRHGVQFFERPHRSVLTSAYISLPPVCRLCTSDKWWQSYPVTAKRVAYSARQQGSPLPPSDCKAGASAAACACCSIPRGKGTICSCMMSGQSSPSLTLSLSACIRDLHQLPKR